MTGHLAERRPPTRSQAINNCMEPSCHSNHRCCRPACAACAWRYALRLSRRILATEPRRLFQITIEARLPDLTTFPGWRKAVRNLVDHRRRADIWWGEVGLWLWLAHDGTVRGIVSLGGVTEVEFATAFRRRWPVRVRPCAVGDVRQQVYFAIHPDRADVLEGLPGRYQRVKVAVEPKRAPRSRSGTRQPHDPDPSRWLEPLPVLV